MSRPSGHVMNLIHEVKNGDDDGFYSEDLRHEALTMALRLAKMKGFDAAADLVLEDAKKFEAYMRDGK